MCQASQKAEAAAKKAEAKALAAKEEAELTAKKPAKPSANKVLPAALSDTFYYLTQKQYLTRSKRLFCV